MNRNKILNQSNSQIKIRRMWRGVIWVFILALNILNSSCNKEDSSQNNSTPQIPDEYYVKYIVNSSTIYSGGKLNVIIKNEKNQDLTISIGQNLKWETTIGPVKKDFYSRLIAVAAGTTSNKLKLYTELHVCKNANPFALKGVNGSDTPRDSAELSYTIDY